jgi:tripartite-type tricarboxylate transporter receptor subunit TctC
LTQQHRVARLDVAFGNETSGYIMHFPRRRFLTLAAGGLALPAIRPAQAQDYPARPVRILVGYSAGGVSDILARLLAQQLSERLGQPFVVEDRPGAASNIATEAVVRAAPDGYTLLLAGLVNAINGSLYKQLSFNFVRDVAPVSLVSRSPLVMEVNPSFPAKTVPEFIAYAKAHPDSINMACAGIGGATHVSGELFQMMTGIKMVTVAYNGSPPALADLIAGRTQVMFDNVASSVPLIQSGKLRALATTTRIAALPDTPAISEFVPGYAADVWNGIVAPKNTPAPIVDKLNSTLVAIMADPKVKAQMTAMGNTAVSNSPAEFARLIAADSEKWAQVIKFADIKL